MFGNRVLNQFRVILAAAQSGGVSRQRRKGGGGLDISRPLTDFLLGSILYFKPDNSIHAPNRALTAIGRRSRSRSRCRGRGRGRSRCCRCRTVHQRMQICFWIGLRPLERAHCHREQERQVEGSSVEETKEQGSLDCCCCCCSCCLVQWHVRLLFAMGSWPAFANGVPNTICGRPRLDVRLVVWPAQFGSISIRRRCSQLVAQVPQQHSADEQMQCLIKHSDWFAARD